MSTPVSSLAERRERQRAHDRARDEHHARRSDLLRPQRDTSELQVIAADASTRFAEASTDEVLAWVAEEFGYRTAVACSMADAVLPHVVARHLPWVDTLFLETGYHFAETIGTRDAVEAGMELTIVDVTPAQSVEEQDAAQGPRLYERDPGLCCQLRKVEPLHRTLQDYEVWITGVRREESPTRADTPLVSWDAKNGLVKVNPLAAWTFDELLDYAEQHGVIVNPLVQDGYPSIGCAPCTRRVAPGEDPRAGRWAGLDKTECGLHT
ncbi:phosphoadenylyl-sulfate reductase [Aeromicrobium phragmitis]|uniref:Adenosine 5'-phosphosulfate reductase n=1 Tax=Aeromicrobium phragmitis TaxID=2478914 RepID=A0A3L8PJP1_9ACTN|nr:phosphoadenylyl-sulfate reductase [Aeromicrobium phragmitis]RLV55565.1 phosphoadenylyl-sulfate reductase [Aeromicrobium phragmitis]